MKCSKCELEGLKCSFLKEYCIFYDKPQDKMEEKIRFFFNDATDSVKADVCANYARLLGSKNSALLRTKLFTIYSEVNPIFIITKNKNGISISVEDEFVSILSDFTNKILPIN